VCFSLAFSTVIQVFLTSFLVDSGYEIPIQNVDELFTSGIKVAFPPGYSSFFEIGDETKDSNIQKYIANCPTLEVCVEWAKDHRNVSVYFSDIEAKMHYATGYCFGENSEPLLCSLKEGVILHSGIVMVMLHGDPLLRRVNEIIRPVVEAGIYNYWFSLRIHWLKLHYKKIGIVQPFDEYYSFTLYHMQPAFYLLLMCWCLSVICFMFEILYNPVFRKYKMKLILY
jgi:hypothetical protein